MYLLSSGHMELLAGKCLALVVLHIPSIPNEELLEFVDKGNRLSKPELCSDEM